MEPLMQRSVKAPQTARRAAERSPEPVAAPTARTTGRPSPMPAAVPSQTWQETICARIPIPEASRCCANHLFRTTPVTALTRVALAPMRKRRERFLQRVKRVGGMTVQCRGALGRCLDRVLQTGVPGVVGVAPERRGKGEPFLLAVDAPHVERGSKLVPRGRAACHAIEGEIARDPSSHDA